MATGFLHTSIIQAWSAVFKFISKLHELYIAAVHAIEW